MDFREINKVKIDAKMHHVFTTNNEAQTLVGIVKKMINAKAIDCAELTEWEENDLNEYAFECAEELTQLKHLVDILSVSILETSLTLAELDKAIDEVEEDGI